MTNLQDAVPVLGDLPLLPKTYYSIELYAEHFVPERNATFNFMQEEDVYWDEDLQGWTWVWGRQEKFHLVRTPTNSDGVISIGAGRRIWRAVYDGFKRAISLFLSLFRPSVVNVY